LAGCEDAIFTSKSFLLRVKLATDGMLEEDQTELAEGIIGRSSINCQQVSARALEAV
jgi:hypothetical protein